MRLQARLAITVALAAAIAILVMALGFSILGARQQRQVVDDQLLETVSQPRQLLADVARAADNRNIGPGPRGGLGQVFEGNPDDVDRLFTRVRVVGPGGQVLLDDGLPEIDPGRISQAEISTVVIDDERFRMAVAPVGADGRSTLQVARNIEGLEDGLARFRLQVLAASAFGIALAAILGSLVARRLGAPITEVAAAAREMAADRQIPSRIEVNRNDEVGDLAASFNDMLSTLELSREQQQRLVGDASHELRTPLTSLRLKLDLLDSTPDLAPAQRQELLATSAAEVEQLGDLVTELVDLATDPTGSDEQAIQGSLAQLATDAAARQGRRSGREIVVVGGDSQETFAIRPRMVSRAISNLVDNAVKYSPPGTPITVAVEGPRVQAIDVGPGIRPEDLPHVFDRFFRSPSARTRPGSGIGLAIVQRVAAAHGGEVWARNAADGTGAIVGFSIAPNEEHKDV